MKHRRKRLGRRPGETLGLVRCPRVGNRIDRGCKVFIGQVFRFEKNREAFVRPITNLESEQRVGIGEQCVGLIDRVTRQIALARLVRRRSRQESCKAIRPRKDALGFRQCGCRHRSGHRRNENRSGCRSD